MRGAAWLLVLSMGANASAADWSLRMDGLGPLRIGMTFKQANAGLGNRLTRAPEGNECRYIAVPGHSGVALMFDDGRLQRVDVGSRSVRTAKGIAIGDPVSRVMRAYPGVEASAHKYVDGEQYLTVPGPRQRYGLRFETAQGKISKFYGGTYAAVQLVERCS